MLKCALQVLSIIISIIIIIIFIIIVLRNVFRMDPASDVISLSAKAESQWYVVPRALITSAICCPGGKVERWIFKQS